MPLVLFEIGKSARVSPITLVSKRFPRLDAPGKYESAHDPTGMTTGMTGLIGPTCRWAVLRVPGNGTLAFMTRGEDGPSDSPRQRPSVVVVLTFLLSRQTTTRREISQHTGLSAAAVTKALRPMLAAGLIAETSLPRAAGLGAGRPTQQVQIVASRVTVLGIKLTADELIAVVTNLGGRIIEELRRPLPDQDGGVEVDTVIGRIADVVTEMASRHRLEQVGVAISGDVDTDRGVVVLSPLLGWRDVPFAARLAEHIAPPVIIDNDIRALTVAEQAFGDAFGIDNFAVVTIGEGIGCGLVIGGRVLRGAYGVAGELGHMIINAATAPPVDAATHERPQVGQVEQLISRSAVMARAAGSGGPLPHLFADLIETAADGDERTRSLLRAVAQELGIAIANVVNLTGPQRLVISSEDFALEAAFDGLVDDTIRSHAFGQAAQVEIIHREIPFTEWARGAAVVALTRQVLLA